MAIRDARRHRNGDRTHQHRDRQRKTDLARVQGPGGEPYRQEWQLYAKGDEQRRVKDLEPKRKSASLAGLRRGGLSGSRRYHFG